MWRNIFWRKKKRDKETFKKDLNLPEIIMQSKEVISDLIKRCDHIERKIAAQDAEVKRLLKLSNKDGALMALKKKKMLEAQAHSFRLSQLTLEQQILSMESTQSQTVAVSALSAGLNAQKQLNQHINMNKLDNLIEDLQDQKDIQQEVITVLSQGISSIDDDEAMNELNAIEASELKNELQKENLEVPKEPLRSPTFTNEITKDVTERFAQLSDRTCDTGNIKKLQSDEEQLQALMGELA